MNQIIIIFCDVLVQKVVKMQLNFENYTCGGFLFRKIIHIEQKLIRKQMIRHRKAHKVVSFGYMMNPEL